MNNADLPPEEDLTAADTTSQPVDDARADYLAAEDLAAESPAAVDLAALALAEAPRAEGHDAPVESESLVPEVEDVVPEADAAAATPPLEEPGAEEPVAEEAAAETAYPPVPAPADLPSQPVAASPMPSPAIFARRHGAPARSAFGRVDEDGIVYVKTTDDERAVGSYPGAAPAEALAYFARCPGGP